MPFPRFENLPEERRTGLLEAAAREFAAHGYADASINRILAGAGMSKGVAYYYFADKADLFAATVAHCGARLRLIDDGLEPATLTAATFWPTFARLRREPLLRSYAHPWLFGALKAAGRLGPADLRAAPLAEYAHRLRSYITGMLRRGQSLGVVRADLPDDLLFAWLQALDRASDDWLLAHWAAQTPDTLAGLSDATVEAMRRAISPLEHPLG
jgi:AcrR family transcriptional regulator